MKIERVKKNHKKEIIIGGLILISVVSAITLVTTRAKYRVTQNIKLARGIVNYVPYDYKIMAMYQKNDSGEYTEIKEMPESGYVINEEKSYCNLASGSKDTTAVLKTIEGNHTISSLNKGDKCYVWFDKKDPSKEMLAKLNITPKDGTPDFTKIATTDEGVYSVSDGMYGGTSYYWRGAVTNNYVKFANKCWRIIRINGDGSIRLIYDGTTCHVNGTTGEVAVASQQYNASRDRSEYVGWTYSTGSQRTTGGTASNIKWQTDTWYNNNIGNNDTYKDKVADGKFCNDRNVASGYTWSSQPSSEFYYAGYERSVEKSSSSVTPTLSCTNVGDIYTLKAGAITMDEVIMAGAKYATANSNYYLYNRYNYWTMSPSYWYKGIGVSMFYVNSGGHIWYNANVSVDNGIRPVINLRSDITFSSGNGTQSSPYVVS